jgi:hypothetical protein
VGFFSIFTITSWYEDRSHITDKAAEPSAPILNVPIPSLPVSVAEKVLESLSSTPSIGGNEKLFPFQGHLTVHEEHLVVVLKADN